MKPQFEQVSGNAWPRRSMAPLPIAWSSVTRSSQPCQSSWPQNGQDMRAPRLRKKSKMGCFAVIRAANLAHRPNAKARWLTRSHRPEEVRPSQGSWRGDAAEAKRASPGSFASAAAQGFKDLCGVAAARSVGSTPAPLRFITCGVF